MTKKANIKALRRSRLYLKWYLFPLKKLKETITRVTSIHLKTEMSSICGRKRRHCWRRRRRSESSTRPLRLSNNLKVRVRRRQLRRWRMRLPCQRRIMSTISQMETLKRWLRRYLRNYSQNLTKTRIWPQQCFLQLKLKPKTNKLPKNQIMRILLLMMLDRRLSLNSAAPQSPLTRISSKSTYLIAKKLLS